MLCVCMQSICTFVFTRSDDEPQLTSETEFERPIHRAPTTQLYTSLNIVSLTTTIREEAHAKVHYIMGSKEVEQQQTNILVTLREHPGTCPRKSINLAGPVERKKGFLYFKASSQCLPRMHSFSSASSVVCVPCFSLLLRFPISSSRFLYSLYMI